MWATESRISHHSPPRGARRRRGAYTLRRLTVAVCLAASGLRVGGPVVLGGSHCHGSPETAAIGRLRTIAYSQIRFRDGDLDGDGAADFATSLAVLSQAGLIDTYLATGRKGLFAYHLTGDGETWSCSATPLVSSWRCQRSWPERSCSSSEKYSRNFIVCQDGIVRYSLSGPATCQSEPIQ